MQAPIEHCTLKVAWGLINAAKITFGKANAMYG
jgi:hypothetical protein